jgi:hypothetical protein
VQFNNHNVPSAVTFFVVSIFYLSGAINVILFLVVRPKLLLFPRPKQLGEQKVERTSQEDTGPAIFADTENFHRSPEPTSPALWDGGSNYVNSGRISDDI